MKELIKLMNEKYTENGDKAYKTTGNNLSDLFFMTPYFEKNLDEATIGDSEKEKLFSMYIRDPRFGLGRRDLGRRLMYQSKVPFYNIVKAGRYDDLWNIPTEENINYFRAKLIEGDELLQKQLKLTENEIDLINHSVTEMEMHVGLDREAAMADMRYSFIEVLCKDTVKRASESKEYLRRLKKLF